nr:hypothetical protein [Tanacetum cinerariifolium]
MLAKFIDEGVTTRGGKMMSEVTGSKEINDIGINKNEPLIFEQDVQEKPHNDTLVQIPKYAKYLKSLLTNKSRLEEACTKTMNERCSAVLLNKLPLKEKDLRSFTIPCQVFEKHKKAEDLAANHLSRFENPHMEVLTEKEIADKFSDEHLMVLKSKFNNDEPWAIKRTLERSVGYNPKGWSEKLNDALWGFRAAYKTSTRCTPFRLVYGRACHLPVEIEHKAQWALKQCNMDLTLASKSRLMQLNELAELRDGAYENTRIYKERTNKWHNSRLSGDKDLKVGDQVLLYNSRMKMYPGKLKSKWNGPNIVKTVYPHRAIEITNMDGFSFKDLAAKKLTKLMKHRSSGILLIFENLAKYEENDTLKNSRPLPDFEEYVVSTSVDTPYIKVGQRLVFTNLLNYNISVIVIGEDGVGLNREDIRYTMMMRFSQRKPLYRDKDDTRMQQFCNWTNHEDHVDEDHVFYTLFCAYVTDGFKLTIPYKFCNAHPDMHTYTKAYVVYFEVRYSMRVQMRYDA